MIDSKLIFWALSIVPILQESCNKLFDIIHRVWMLIFVILTLHSYSPLKVFVSDISSFRGIQPLKNYKQLVFCHLSTQIINIGEIQVSFSFLVDLCESQLCSSLIDFLFVKPSIKINGLWDVFNEVLYFLLIGVHFLKRTLFKCYFLFY